MKILGREFLFHTKQKNKPVNSHTSSSRNSAREMDEFKKIVAKITEQFKDRSRKDIQKWRQALKMAEHPEKPRLNFYHDLIDDLMTDGHLQAQIELRENSTLNTEFHVKGADGNINEEATNLFRQKWFYDFLKEAIGSKLRGTKVLEFQSFSEEKLTFEVIPQRNVVPGLKMVFPDLSKEEGILYNDPYYENWIIQIGKDNELGILNNIVPNLIWKRNVMQAWAEFCERFGLPMVSATTNQYDTETINKIDFQLRQLGQAARGIFPQGTTVEFKEANRTDAFQTFDKFTQRNNGEISKPIVGGTMLTDDGSSKSQSEVHERNIDDKIAVSDKRSITFLVNDNLIPLLQAQGYAFIKEGDRFAFNQSHNLDLDVFWNITQGVMAEYEVDEEWLSNTFSIPILGKKKSPMTLLPSASLPSGIHFPVYPKSCCKPMQVRAASSRFNALMKKYHRELFNALWEEKDTLSATAKITALESKELLKGLFKGWGDRRLEIGYDAPDHLAMQMMEFNIFEFSSSKTEARLASLSELLIDKEALQIRSFSDFKKEAEKITTDFNGAWLETEYNLSISVGQNSASFARFMEEKDTVTSLVRYETVGDTKVRSEHQLLNGKVFDLNDTEARDLWPPNGYGCRCEMVQHLGDTKTVISKGSTAKRLLGDKFKDSQFDVNRGDLKQVFTKEQFYSAGKALDKDLKNMTYNEVYGLEEYSTFKNRLKPLKLDTTITKDNVSELFKKDGKIGTTDFMGYEDHLKRKVILKKTTFNKYTQGKYAQRAENRHQIVPHLADILKNPDESWMHAHNTKNGTFQTRYIQFHKDQAIVVDTQIGEKTMEIVNWYPMKKDGDTRKGILIHKKA